MEPLELTFDEYKRIYHFCHLHCDWIIEDLADALCEDTNVGYGMCIQIAQIALGHDNFKTFCNYMLEWQLDKVHVYY